MDYRARIVAGTALALIMAAPSLSAAPLSRPSTQVDPHALAPQAGAAVILAQAEGGDGEEELRRKREREERRQERRDERQEERQDEPTAAEPIPGQPAEPPAQEAPPAGGAEPIPGQPAEPPAEEAPPPPQTEAPRPPAQEAPPAEEAPRPPAQGEQPPSQPPAQPPAGGAEPIPGQPAEPPAEEAPPPPQTEAPRPPAQEAPPAEEAPPPQTEAPRPPAQGEQPPAQPPAGGAEPIPGQPAEPPAQEEEAPPADEAPPQTEVPRPPAQGEQPPDQPPAQPPAGGAEPIPGQPPAGQPPATQPPANQPPAGSQPQPPAAPGAVEPVQEGQAPVLDSQKEEVRDGDAQQPEQAPAAEAPPPPRSDEEAREAAQPDEVISVRKVEGRRLERRPERRERREEAEVVREIGDRIVIEINNQVIVESDDRDRIGRGAEEVYYEELPRGDIRETVVRPNGVQVVTIRNRYGDIVQRSRIMPDGREYFLVYADERDRDGPREWRDPAADLPPLVLTIPASEYVLDAGRVEDPDVYYEFLDQPPVERVQRLYTIDEVKYSARVRDSVRRIDLDTITFEFGSASISESEIPRLEGVAAAMERLLEENPAETFLIEGHTDAVGSDVANLALSDGRAELVAAALTNVFGIPPENLVTQGYGEQYLKVRTEEPERENRRVAMRRITPLIAPVASSQ